MISDEYTVSLTARELRRLEDRIRELCGKVVAVPEAEFNQTMRELRKALHEHVDRPRQLAAARIPCSERRKPSYSPGIVMISLALLFV